jgi:geranylgeranyl reductase
VPSAVGRSDGDFLAEEAAQAVKAQSKENKLENEKEKAGIS